jgi:hypothetical protein
MAKFLTLPQWVTVQRTPVALAVMMIIMLVPFMAGCVTMQHYQTATEGRFEFGVIGDQEYTAEDEAKFPRLIRVMNDANPAFVVHVGDFQETTTVTRKVMVSRHARMKPWLTLSKCLRLLSTRSS